MYKCPGCLAEYNQADAYSQVLKCIRCGDTKLALDTKYTIMLEGAKKGEHFVKQLTEMMKELEDDTLPESFIVNRKAIPELDVQRVTGKKRKIRNNFVAPKEPKVKISFDDKKKVIPIFFRVKLLFHT